MTRTFTALGMTAAASALLTTIGCTTSTPVEPTSLSSTSITAAAAADGSTLKATAPTLVSPINSQQLSTQRPTLTISPASGLFVNETFSYEFELQSDGGAVLGAATVNGTSWDYPNPLNADTSYRWRARAALDGAFGPWSATQTFRTISLPGCVNGVLADARAYFFSVIGRKEGDLSPDWAAVLLASGIPGGYPAGVAPPPGAPYYGLTQQLGGAGPRGVVFLPTATPDSGGFYSRQILVTDGQRWVWFDRFPDGPPYAPRPCP